MFTPFRFPHLDPAKILVRSRLNLDKIIMSSFEKLVRIVNGPTNWSWKPLFSGSGTIRILERLNRFWVKNPVGSWCNLLVVSNLVRIQGTSPLQALSRIFGLPNQDPDPHWVKSRVTSEENLVSNPGRIQKTSPLQDSTRNSSFPEEKRAFPCRILFRSVTELERKSHGSPLGKETAILDIQTSPI